MGPSASSRPYRSQGGWVGTGWSTEWPRRQGAHKAAYSQCRAMDERRPALSSLYAGHADGDARRFPRGVQSKLVGFDDPHLKMHRLFGRPRGQKKLGVGDRLSGNYRNSVFRIATGLERQVLILAH